MSQFNVQQCPVCGGGRFSPFITCTDFFISGEPFQIKECDTCKLKITDNAEDQENIGRYYQSKEYISHSNISKGIQNKLYHKVRKYMLGRKRKMVEQLSGSKSGHILDIGAGTGHFLNEMNRYGWRVSGTEKSSAARNFAHAKFSLHLHKPADLFRMEDESFDTVTLWHVLEHIHNLDENMKAIARLLKPGKPLFIAVPNTASYDARHYKEYWAAWDVPRHLWHFAPEQMIKFGQKHQFRFIQINTMPFDAFYVSLLSEKYKKSKLPFFNGVIHGKISWLISNLNKRRCSSLIYVFEKKAI